MKILCKIFYCNTKFSPKDVFFYKIIQVFFMYFFEVFLTDFLLIQIRNFALLSIFFFLTNKTEKKIK